MKLKIISDLHTDINQSVIEYDGGIEGFRFVNELKDIDWLLIAGDISGSYKNTYKFLLELEEHIKNNNLKTKVVCVAGNHESYDSKTENMTRSEIISKLKLNFMGEDNVYFVENDVIELDNNNILFGCCLYTNFGHSIYNERISVRCINDFRHTYEYDVYEDKTLPVTPQDYIKWHTTSVNKLVDMCEKHRDKNIIVLTHFAPSFKSISLEYVTSPLNPFYATNLEDVIKENKNIKYFVHGHVHSPCKYNINQCTVLCFPMGYTLYDSSGTYPSEYSGVDFEI